MELINTTYWTKEGKNLSFTKCYGAAGYFIEISGDDSLIKELETRLQVQVAVSVRTEGMTLRAPIGENRMEGNDILAIAESEAMKMAMTRVGLHMHLN